jgi:hypothetical protein
MLASSNGHGWFPGVKTNMASSGSKGTPLGVSIGIGAGAGAIVTLALGVFVFMMEKKAKKQNNSESKSKETLREWYKFEDTTYSQNGSDLTPQTSTEVIPALVIEE